MISIYDLGGIAMLRALIDMAKAHGQAAVPLEVLERTLAALTGEGEVANAH